MLNQGEIFAGRYRIDGTLGHGGMGTVYRAFDQLTRELVALKLIDPALAHQQLLVEKFKQELSLARRITHPNVVRIYDLGASGETLFISMELVEGRTLADELKGHGPLAPDRARSVLRQFLDAMREIHACRVLHRDIKPSNVMVTPAGAVKVMDFGIARDLSSDRTIGLLAFTPGYVAPEVVTGQTATYTSDIYSIGAMVHELLLGHKPSAAPQAEALPVEWRPLVLGCLHADPSSRPQSIEQVQLLLNGLGAPEAIHGGAARPGLTELLREGGGTAGSEARTLTFESGKPAPAAPPVRHAAVERRGVPPVVKGLLFAGVGVAAAVLAYFFLRPVPPRPAAELAVAPVATQTNVPPALPLRLPSKGGEMVLIAAGSFRMGADGRKPRSKSELDSSPAHEVTLPDFYIDRREVDNGALQPFAAASGSTWSGGGRAATLPAMYVPRDLAAAYCAGVGKRLPSEREWEKASAGSRHVPGAQPFAVDRADDATPRGVLNMASNAVEWVAGEATLYPGNAGLSPPGLRVFRGFGFGLVSRDAGPSTFRGGVRRTDETRAPIGFRCAADASVAGPG